MIDVFVFDLDGVIIDSAADLAGGVNKMLSHFSLKTLDEKLLVSFVGNGAKKLVERALFASTDGKIPTESEDFNTMFKWYVDFYEQNPVNKTVLYPKIDELLKNLFEKEKKIALLTNKPSKIATKILQKFEILQFFHCVSGPEQVKNLKPNPEGLVYTLQKINEKSNKTYTKDNVIMVGDSSVDIKAGKAFGCKTAGITGGIGNTQSLLAEKPDIVLKFAFELENSVQLF